MLSHWNVVDDSEAAASATAAAAEAAIAAKAVAAAAAGTGVAAAAAAAADLILASTPHWSIRWRLSATFLTHLFTTADIVG